MGMRMKLVARDALLDRMIRKDFSNRRLAKYAECAPGTIDNLLNGRTQAVNKPRTAELICEALDVPLDVFFVPEISNNERQSTARRKVPA
ncbi:hypothetical protein RhoFasB10_03828 [Rhodococcus sp. B10]|nr:helix-turn-helix transcriptional regulator [Rhodococcus sp. B10]NIL77677.1 hypothetical protein [Rhodococcus sp. B10]